MDESSKQLIEMRDSIPVKPGREARIDYEYIRRSQYIHGKRAAEREKDGGSNHYKDKSGLGSFYQKDIRWNVSTGRQDNIGYG